MEVRRLIAWHVLMALLFAGACQRAPASVPPQPAPAATVADSSGPAPSAAEGGTPNRLAVAGSTRGTVACGTSRCAVPAEICVSLAPTAGAGSTFRCVPKGRELEVEQAYACDDASDCADGQACCLGLESASLTYACSERSGARANCALEICVEAGGTPCPSGQVCKAGVCAPDGARATCNGGQRCPLSAPMCVWAKGAASCTLEPTGPSEGEPSSTDVRMSCSSKRDCGDGLRCCTNALGNSTSCRVNCDYANNQELCEHDADCPTGGSSMLRCLPANFGESPRFPAWIRFCQAR